MVKVGDVYRKGNETDFQLLIITWVQAEESKGFTWFNIQGNRMIFGVVLGDVRQRAYYEGERLDSNKLEEEKWKLLS